MALRTVGWSAVALGAAVVLAASANEGQVLLPMGIALVGGVLAAFVAVVTGRSFGGREDLPLARHPGWFRYTSGRSGSVGVLCMAAFVLTGLSKGGAILGPPALLCLVLGIAAAPAVFVLQRRRAARSLPPSIR